MNKGIMTAAMVVGSMALWPAVPLEAANPHIFKFQALWSVNPDGECGRPYSQLFIHTTEADVDVVEVSYVSSPDPCVSADFVSGSGQVDISGNLSKLSVEGTIPAGDSEIEIDLLLRKTRNLPDPGPGQQAVSATARGTVILDGVDITGGQPSTSASIVRSKG